MPCLQKKVGLLLNVLRTENTGKQQQKQKDHGNYASGERDRQQKGNPFPKKADTQHEADLKDNFHGDSRLSVKNCEGSQT